MPLKKTTRLRTRCAAWALALPFVLAACSTTETTPASPAPHTALTDATMLSKPAPAAEPAATPPAEIVAPLSPRAPGATTQMLAWAYRTRGLPSTELSLEITRLLDIPDSQRVPANDLQITQRYVVYPGEERIPLRHGAVGIGLGELVEVLGKT